MTNSRVNRIRNGIIHGLILVLILIGSIIFFEHTINQAAPDSAAVMDNSTFPLVYMTRGQVSFNCLSGYTTEMNAARMRDTITPLENDRSIGIRVQAFAASIDGISYEVFSPDGKQVLENTKVIKTDQANDELTAKITLQNKLLMDQEYPMKLTVTCGGRNIYYYTRVLLADGLHTDEYLNYVTGFYDKTVNRSDLNTVGAAVEPDETTDEDATLARMDIHDSVAQLTWGNLFPQIFYKPTPRICEINKNTASLTLEYRIAAVGESGKTEIYNVKEFYRVRFTDSRVFLLTFERSTDEVFNPDNGVLTGKGIRLGITGKDAQYSFDEKNRIIAFVQENELWSYDRTDGRLTQIFSFPQRENMDYRDFKDGSDIRILRISSMGDVYFLITGYMNRGAHEGENGLSLCYYDAATALTEEKLFIQSPLYRELICRDTANVAYVTEDGKSFYVLVDQQIWKISIDGMTSELIADGIPDGCARSCMSGRYAAWITGNTGYDAAVLDAIDFETGQTIRVEAGEGEKIRPLCYMNDDLVYGTARDSDLEKADLQSGYFPMYRLTIMNPEGETVKEYMPGSELVTGITQYDHMLSLTRVKPAAGGKSFEEAPPDEIVNTKTGESVNIGIATQWSDRKQNEVYLRVGSEISDDTYSVVRAKVVRSSSPRVMQLPENRTYREKYLVYAMGGLYDILPRENEGVAVADTMVGTALTEGLDYIWERGNRGATAKIPLEKVPDWMKSGITDKEQIDSREGVRGLDLTGCTMEEVLYYVSKGTPVAAVTKEGPVTIVGYDEFNTMLLDPDGTEWYYYGLNDSTEMFAESGNQFITYIKEVKQEETAKE